MRIVPPQPFTFEGGERAVLLLHGFTGTTADVRMLGRYLQKRGYTCHAPLYDGHGVPPEQLLETSPDDWWENVRNGYEFLRNEGFVDIAVAGLSLGGVFSLKIGYTLPVKGIVTMCAPMTVPSEESIYENIVSYAKKYKQLEGKTAEQITEEIAAFKRIETSLPKQLAAFFLDVKRHLEKVTAPLLVVQARHDEVIDANSANIIYEHVSSEEKTIEWFERSSHVITIGEEKELLHEKIEQFLERLDWSR